MEVNIKLEFVPEQRKTVLTLNVWPLAVVTEDLTEDQSREITDKLIAVLRQYIPIAPAPRKGKH